MPFEEKKYYCTESENSYTETELRNCYHDFGYDETETYEEFKENCMYYNNGTLVQVKMLSAVVDMASGKTIYSVWNIKTDLEV